MHGGQSPTRHCGFHQATRRHIYHEVGPWTDTAHGYESRLVLQPARTGAKARLAHAVETCFAAIVLKP